MVNFMETPNLDLHSNYHEHFAKNVDIDYLPLNASPTDKSVFIHLSPQDKMLHKVVNVKVIIIGNGIDNLSSNPGYRSLHFTY